MFLWADKLRPEVNSPQYRALTFLIKTTVSQQIFIDSLGLNQWVGNVLDSGNTAQDKAFALMGKFMLGEDSYKIKFSYKIKENFFL